MDISTFLHLRVSVTAYAIDYLDVSDSPTVTDVFMSMRSQASPDSTIM